MDEQALRLLIQRKLVDGKLPRNSIPRIWGGPGHGEWCDACELAIPSNVFIIEGIAEGGSVQFHGKCFYLWESMRRPEPS